MTRCVTAGSAALVAWSAMSHSNAEVRYRGLLLLVVILAVMLAVILAVYDWYPVVLGILIGIATFLVLGATSSPAQVAVAGLMGLLLMVLYDAEEIL